MGALQRSQGFSRSLTMAPGTVDDVASSDVAVDGVASTTPRMAAVDTT